MKIIILIILLLQTNFIAQSVSGIILDKKTGKPIPNANVLISNTYFGTTSDDKGIFKIKNLPLGNHELIISCIGYSLEIKKIEVPSAKEIKVLLKPKIYNLSNVNIVSKKPDKWLENYEIFKTLFIGEEGFYDDCEITNKEMIQFRWKDNILSAWSEVPLIVINNALGFKIDCYIVNFDWIKFEGIIKYSIKTKFSDLDTNVSETIMENRAEAYQGTLEHFLNCLVNDEVLECGYNVYINSSSFDSRLLSQSDKMISRDELITKVKNKNYFILKFDGYLKIVNDRKVSWLRLNQNQVMLDENGYPIDSFPFEVQGYWSKIGISEMLPKYFNVLK